MSTNLPTQRKVPTAASTLPADSVPENRSSTCSTYGQSDANPSSASYQRVRAYWAQGLILFNVYGIPLSSGLWLEYTYTTLLPTTSLTLISLVTAFHLFSIFAAIPPSRWLYTRLPTRRALLLAIAIVTSARISTTIRHTYTALLVCAALTGVGLGMLGTLHTLRLASHYRNNTGLAATYSVAAGFLGAVVHTAVTWSFLRRERYAAAHVATLAVFVSTSVAGVQLSQPCRTPVTPRLPLPTRPNRNHFTRESTAALGAVLLGATMLLAPAYLPLTVSQSLHPDAAAAALVAAFTTTLVVAPFAARVSRRHGRTHQAAPMALVALASVFAAAGIVLPAFSPVLWAGVLGGAMYGAGLGVVGSCAGEVIGERGARWGSVVVCAIGAVAAGGCVGVASVVEMRADGARVALGVVATGMVSGGALLGLGEMKGRV